MSCQSVLPLGPLFSVAGEEGLELFACLFRTEREGELPSNPSSIRYAVHTGFWRGNIAPGREWGLNLNERTIAEMLKGYGYSTHMVGLINGFDFTVYLPSLLDLIF